MTYLKNLNDLDFIPYKRYGTVIEKIFWYNINYSDKTGIGSYVLKFEPGAKTKEHIHLDTENFIVLKGSIYDSFYKMTFKKNSFISLEKDTIHYSSSDEGCILLVFSQGHIKRF